MILRIMKILICCGLFNLVPAQGFAAIEPTVNVEAVGDVPVAVQQNAAKFFTIVKSGTITREMLEEVFMPTSYENEKEARLRRILSFFNMEMNVPDPITIEPRGVDNYAVLLQNNSGNHVEISLSMPASENYLLGAFGAALAPAPIEPSMTGLSDTDIADAVDKYLEDLAARQEFSGSVVIAREGRPFYMTFLGFADRDTGRRMTIDTPINLGSANKMWTALAIGQLVEAGKLDWNDTIGKFLPNYPNAEARDKVTIHHLLSHSAGLGGFFNDKYNAIKFDLFNVQDLMMTFADEPLQYEPGSRTEYSNAGPIVLGRIIEVVTGEDYYDYIKSNVIDKAGMQNSGFFHSDETLSGKAIGYGRAPGPDGHASADGELLSNASSLGKRGSPAGGAYASARDMLKYSNALMDGLLVSKDTLNRLTTPSSRNFPYGYLFGLGEINGYRTIGHNGGAPGISADFKIFPELGYTVIVLSNFGGKAIAVSDRIAGLVANGATAEANAEN